MGCMCGFFDGGRVYGTCLPVEDADDHSTCSLSTTFFKLYLPKSHRTYTFAYKATFRLDTSQNNESTYRKKGVMARLGRLYEVDS